MTKRVLLTLPLALGLTLVACSSIDPKPPHFETSLAQAGPFEGRVTALHTKPDSVSTENKTSKGTVYFSSEVRPATDFQKLHIGDRIEGRIVVEPHTVYIADVRIIR
jgi:hypothetical protein